MLSTGRKSGSSWLDRLRFSKGLPVENHPDLEHFLNPNPNPVSIPESDQNSVPLLEDEQGLVTGHIIPAEKSNSEKHNQEKPDLYGIISHVLSDLFVMGNPMGFPRIGGGFDERNKGRKQKNPKICPVVTTRNVDNSKSDNGGVVAKKNACVAVDYDYDDDDDDDDDKLEFNNFKGYSREDVVIIDTSALTWKSQKKIYRKASVWKIRDNKSKFKRVYESRKKAKSTQLDKEIQQEKKMMNKNKNKLKKKMKKKQRLFGLPDIITTVHPLSSSQNDKTEASNQLTGKSKKCL